MNKTILTRTLLAAGVLAAAGLAQAQTSDVPTQAGEASTMTQGAPNAATTNSPYPDGTITRSYIVGPSQTTIMGAAPVYVSPAPVYVHPAPLTVDRTRETYEMGSASATANVPGRAGEASTMTNGVPNASTNNYASGGGHVLDGPYYDRFGHRVYVY